MKKIDKLLEYMIQDKIGPLDPISNYTSFDFYLTRILRVNTDELNKKKIYDILKIVLYTSHTHNINTYIRELLIELCHNHDQVNHIFFNSLELDINRIIENKTSLIYYLVEKLDFFYEFLSNKNTQVLYSNIARLQDNKIILIQFMLDKIYNFIKNSLDYNSDIYIKDHDNKNALDYAKQIDQVTNTNLEVLILDYYMIKDPGYD